MSALAGLRQEPRCALEPNPHGLLLELAGRAPDGWLAAAREVLANGDRERLDEMVGAAPLLGGQPARYQFTPEGTGSYDDTDRTVIAAVRAAGGTAACWATMRDGVDRIYLVQARDDADLPVITLMAQRAQASHDDPRVEVFAASTELPSYHQDALRAAVLLWTRERLPSAKIARTFDGASAEGGPWFDTAHELVVDPAERQRLLTFLEGGEVVLRTELRMTDLISASAGAVPASLRSDGVWVWSEAARYYLERYQVAPDPAFAGHALANPPASRLTPLQRYRMSVALNPDNEKGTLWRAG